MHNRIKVVITVGYGGRPSGKLVFVTAGYIRREDGYVRRFSIFSLVLMDQPQGVSNLVGDFEWAVPVEDADDLFAASHSNGEGIIAGVVLDVDIVARLAAQFDKGQCGDSAPRCSCVAPSLTAGCRDTWSEKVVNSSICPARAAKRPFDAIMFLC